MPKFETRREDDGDTSFYINDEYQAGWSSAANIPQPLSPAMKQLLEIAYNEGKTARSREIKKLIG